MAAEPAPTVSILDYGDRDTDARRFGRRWPILGIAGLVVAVGLVGLHGLTIGGVVWEMSRESNVRRRMPPLPRPLTAPEAAAFVATLIPAHGRLNPAQAATLAARLQQPGQRYCIKPGSDVGFEVSCDSDGTRISGGTDVYDISRLTLDAEGHITHESVTVYDPDGSRQTTTDAAGVTTTVVGKIYRGSWRTRLTAGCLLVAVAAFDCCWAVVLMVTSAGVLRPSPQAVARLRGWAKVDLVGAVAYVAALTAVICVDLPPQPMAVNAVEVVMPVVVAAVVATYPLGILIISRRSCR